MNKSNPIKRFWRFLNEDTWQSWLVSLILAFVFIKFIFFPVLSFMTGTSLPLVVVESCSMYHSVSDLDKWWNQNGLWYEQNGITKEEFQYFKFSNGLNKGDIVFVYGRGDRKIGDIIIFESEFRNPLIHRVVGLDPIETKGDKNPGQLDQELDIKEDDVLGKAVARVPGLGWIKLIFFEGTRSESQRGFCQ